MEITNPANGAVLFAASELASDDGTVRLAPGFADALRDLRMSFGRPMRVNSCCRTPGHNARVGGSSRSFHLTEGNASNGTCAVDIAVPDDAYRALLVGRALNSGWSVGVYKTFVHLDRRTDFDAPMVTFYGGY